MHRKDYVTIARALKRASPDKLCRSCRENIIFLLCEALKEDNANFSPEKFAAFLHKGGD